MSRLERSAEGAACAACEAVRTAPTSPSAAEDDRGLAFRRELVLLAAAALLGGASFLLGRIPWLQRATAVLAYLVAGWQVLAGAWRGIRSGKLFGELSLMSIATLGAIAIDHYEEAVAVMVFYRVGELLQDSAARRSRNSITALLDLRPALVRIRVGDSWRELPLEEAKAGDVFLVKPGERLALDGRVTDGEAFLDCSALTGESRPRAVAPGAEVLAGCISLDGALTIAADKPAAESAAARIAGLVEAAAARKARTERIVSRFAAVYTPIVVGLAAATATLPPLLLGQSVATWAYRALVMLVISCPCALVLSVPLAYFCGVGGCARRGILVRGAETLEALARVDTVVFDKTGTLTEGCFRVVDIRPAPGRSEDELLALAAAAESLSRHPMAISIRSAAEARGLSLGVEDEASEVREIPGAGVVARVGRVRIAAGNDRLLHREEVPHDRCDEDGSTINVAVDSVFAGKILLGDEVKSDAAAAMRDLARLGVRRTVLLTGDAPSATGTVAEGLGIGELHANLLPEDKLDHLTRIQAERGGGLTAFVGDGINDAPVLAAADVGVAMGSGSDAAIESADVVLMTDEPSRVPEAIAQARRTRKIVLEDIVFALGAKVALLGLGALGLAGMWLAVVGDVGVALAAVANSLRAIGAIRPASSTARGRPAG